MSEAGCRSRGVRLIETALEEFDRVIVIDRRLNDLQLMEAFGEEGNYKVTDKKVLILSDLADKRACNIEWRCVAEGEIEDIMEIYYMYEFSNRITIVTQRQATGSLLDYVNTGLLTREEVVTAVLR